MKIEAIVYTSNTGYTRQYAQLLAQETSLPLYALADAQKALPAGSTVVYLGWLMAGKVQGYAQASGQFSVQALCGVGMGATGSQLEDVRKANTIPETLPVFTLQGGFDRSRLKGVYKLMMSVIANTMAKKLAQKPDRTPDEDDMLDLFQKGGSRVRVENLAGVLSWFREVCA